MGEYKETMAYRGAYESLASASEEGGLLSTTSDMIRWYLSFYSNFEKLGISQAVMDKMLKPKIPIEAREGPCGQEFQGFAQGVFVNMDALSVDCSLPAEWPAPIWYVAGVDFTTVSMAMWPNRETREESDVVAIFSNLRAELPQCNSPDTGKNC